MKITTKLNLTFVCCLIASIAFLTIYISYQLTAIVNEEIKQFRDDSMKHAKSELKNYVDIAYEVVKANYDMAHNETYLKNRYGTRLKSVIEIAYSLIQSNLALAKSGKITLDQARQRSLEEIKELRYDDGTGYVWINDTERPLPRMIMHPINPSLDGKILNDKKFDCADGGKNLFATMVDVCLKDGEGFVKYIWPKPTKDGLTQEQPKLSYVKLVKEWNWVLGTGIYVDDALKDAIVKSKEDIKKMRYDDGTGYFWINNMSIPPKMVMHSTSPGLDGKTLSDPKYNCADGGKNLFSAMVEECKKKGEGFVQYHWDKEVDGQIKKNQPKLSYVREFKPLNWVIGTGCYIDEIDEAVLLREKNASSYLFWINVTIILSSIGLAVVATFIVVVMLRRFVISPLAHISQEASLIAQGALDEIGEGYKAKNPNDEMGLFAKTFALMVSNLRNQISSSELISQGDLSVEVSLASDKDQLGRSLRNMVANLRDLIIGVKTSAEQMGAGSNEINQASQALSQGATSQAASLEEISSSMAEISSQIKTNAENASQVNQLARTTREEAESGERDMKEMLHSMQDIYDASQQIAKINKAIDDIAFQTNILALNAAVEAARAGIHGKGFAVVAEEVRTLAGRSAKAASESAQLVQDALGKVENGQKVAEKTSGSFTQIVSGIVKVTDLAGEIAAASSEQAKGANEINVGLSQIDQVTQQNTASAEETASSAHELSNQAKILNEQVSKFKIDDQDNAYSGNLSVAAPSESKQLPQHSSAGWPT